MKAKLISLYALMAMGLACCISGENPNAQLENEIKQIDDYLIGLGIQDEVLYDNVNGLRIHVHEYGEKAPPQNGQTVTVNFAGRLFSDGTTFTSGTVTDKIEALGPFGFRNTVKNIMTGSNVTVYVPSSSGFGESGTTGVPPGSILIYDIYLSNTQKTASQLAQFKTDSTAIANYIEDNQLPLVYTTGEIWINEEESGIGVYPTPYDIVTFDYKLSLLSNPGTVFEEGTLSEVSVFGLIDGFKIALPLLGEGAKARIIIPSLLGYGATGASGVPSNSNLIYEITLTKVHK